MVSQHSNYILLYDFFSCTFSSRKIKQKKHFSFKQKMLQAKRSLVDDKNNDFSVPEAQGPEKGCVPVTMCSKISRSLMAQNNKHFIICTNSVGWMGSAGAILLFLMMWSGPQSSGTRLGCNTHAGALMAALGCWSSAGSSAADKSTSVFSTWVS